MVTETTGATGTVTGKEVTMEEDTVSVWWPLYVLTGLVSGGGTACIVKGSYCQGELQSWV